jgi:hypothetical protein
MGWIIEAQASRRQPLAPKLRRVAVDAAKHMREYRRELEAAGWVKNPRRPDMRLELPGTELAIEIGYGCGQIRTRLLDGREAVGHLDQRVGEVNWPRVVSELLFDRVPDRMSNVNGNGHHKLVGPPAGRDRFA